MALLYPKLRQRPEHFRINRRHPLAEGLVFAGLAGDGCVGSVDYRDSSLFGNHGTLTNMDPVTDWVWVPELGRWALDFDGSNDWANLGNPSVLNFSDDCTIACWFVPNGAPQQYDCIFTNENGSNTGWRLWTRDASSFTYYWQFGSTYLTSATAWTSGVAVHLAGIRKAGVISLYVNGVSEGTPAAAAAAPSYSGVQAMLCAMLSSGNPIRFSAGKIIDPLAASRAFADSEISALADPSNVMLSGLLLPPRRRLWPVVAASSTNPVEVTETTLYNTEPFAQDEVIGTAQATGGTGTYTWEIVSQTLL